jgi:hypothetical protein
MVVLDGSEKENQVTFYISQFETALVLPDKPFDLIWFPILPL